MTVSFTVTQMEATTSNALGSVESLHVAEVLHASPPPSHASEQTPRPSQPQTTIAASASSGTSQPRPFNDVPYSECSEPPPDWRSSTVLSARSYSVHLAREYKEELPAVQTVPADSYGRHLVLACTVYFLCGWGCVCGIVAMLMACEFTIGSYPVKSIRHVCERLA